MVEQPAVNRLVVGSNPTRGVRDAREESFRAFFCCLSTFLSSAILLWQAPLLPVVREIA